MRTKDTISIAWADPGMVEGEFAIALAQLMVARTSFFGPTIRCEGSALISRIRNDLVAGFLDHTTSAWLLMLDSDEVLTIEAFDKLVATAHDASHPIVAGLYFGIRARRDSYPQPTPMILRATEVGYAPIDDYPTDRVIPVDAAGTGCLLMHRSVLEAMRDRATPDQGRMYCWFQDEPLEGHWWGEDVLFCRKAKALGFPIHAHTGAILPHRKRYWVTDKHFQAERG